jgi:hypothetical protein
MMAQPPMTEAAPVQPAAAPESAGLGVPPAQSAPAEDFLGVPSEDMPFGDTAETDEGAFQFDFLGGTQQQAAPEGPAPAVGAETPLAGPAAPAGATAMAATEPPASAPIPGFGPAVPPLDTAVAQPPESMNFAAEGWPTQAAAPDAPTMAAPEGWAPAPGVTPIEGGAAPAAMPWGAAPGQPGQPGAPVAQPWAQQGAMPADAQAAQPWGQAPGAPAPMMQQPWGQPVQPGQPMDPAQPWGQAPGAAAPMMQQPWGQPAQPGQPMPMDPAQPWGQPAQPGQPMDPAQPWGQPAQPGVWPAPGQYPQQAQPWGAPGAQPMAGYPAEAAPAHETPSSSSDEAVDASLFGGAPAATADGAAAVPRMRPRRPRERNALRELIGAAVGGFLGLFVAYYLLNLIGGEQFNMFDIPLPGIKHTQHNNSGKKKATKARRDEASTLPPGAREGRPAVATSESAGELRLYSDEFLRAIKS